MTSARLNALMLVCTVVAGITGCVEPPRTMPDQSVIQFDGNLALPPDCASLARPSVLTDAGWRRPQMEWGCATYTNLAAQLAHPGDIVKPESLGPTDAAVAASAVHRYQTGHVTPLDPSTSRDSH
jgi:pilus assembly protein CpaD